MLDDDGNIHVGVEQRCWMMVIEYRTKMLITADDEGIQNNDADDVGYRTKMLDHEGIQTKESSP